MIWIGSASYDFGIELSRVSGLPTHHIVPNGRIAVVYLR